MAERTKSMPTEFAEATQKLQDELVPRVAALMRPVLGNEPVNKQERQRRWWQTDDGWTPEQETALLQKGTTREDIGLLKYPYREIDARAAGNGDDDRMIAKYATEMSALGPPPPDALEAAALEIERAKLAEDRELEQAKQQPPPMLPIGSDGLLPMPEMPPEMGGV